MREWWKFLLITQKSDLTLEMKPNVTRINLPTVYADGGICFTVRFVHFVAHQHPVMQVCKTLI